MSRRKVQYAKRNCIDPEEEGKLSFLYTRTRADTHFLDQFLLFHSYCYCMVFCLCLGFSDITNGILYVCLCSVITGEELPFEPRDIVIRKDRWLTDSYSLHEVLGRSVILTSACHL